MAKCGDVAPCSFPSGAGMRYGDGRLGGQIVGGRVAGRGAGGGARADLEVDVLGWNGPSLELAVDPDILVVAVASVGSFDGRGWTLA